MTVTTDYITGTYVIKYKVYNEEVITRLDRRCSNDEFEEWKYRHTSIVRDMILSYLTDETKTTAVH